VNGAETRSSYSALRESIGAATALLVFVVVFLVQLEKQLFRGFIRADGNDEVVASRTWELCDRAAAEMGASVLAIGTLPTVT
jgi:hypothetical protein